MFDFQHFQLLANAIVVHGFGAPLRSIVTSVFAVQNAACHSQKSYRRNSSILAETGGRFSDLLLYTGYESSGRKGKIEVQHQKENAVNNGHKAALQTKHAELDSKIETENSRPHPDDDLIHRLKKQKLHLKDILVQDNAPA